MANSRKGMLIMAVIIILAFIIGSYILTATFFGVLSLVGLIALVESIPPFKWFVQKTTSAVDAVLFVFTIIATMNYGLNIAASLTIMGLGYTLVYAPLLRESVEAKRRNKVRSAKQTHKLHDWR